MSCDLYLYVCALGMYVHRIAPAERIKIHVYISFQISLIMLHYVC